MKDKADLPVDWGSVRERIAKTNFDDGRPAVGPTFDADAQRVLDERARLLARVCASSDADAAGIEVLIFVVSGERYALGIPYVRETVRSAGSTYVPGAPAWFVGIENVRGEIIAVVDIDRLFGTVEPPAHRDPGLLIVLGQAHAEFAIRCDELLTVTVLPKAAVRPLSRVAMSDERRHIVGVTDDAVLLLDGEALLEDERLMVEQVEET